MTTTPPMVRDDPGDGRPVEALQRAHVVVVGAGGLGCPAAWALAEAGVGRLVLIDPDVVELSNLPRQVLYEPADVGRPKALVAAKRLAHFSGHVEGLHARLDDANEAEVLAGADVVVDATDGAPTKDWLNALAVRRGVPLVHAAALRSEGRLLEVPAAGRPCLACLFGRLAEEPGGTCADLGVWGGVVGAVGFLAADAALRRLATPDAPSPGYLVLDVEGGRAFPLGAEADSTCPVCGEHARREPEPYPEAGACDVPTTRSPDDACARLPGSRATLDLVAESCPLNMLRARRAVEELRAGEVLEIHLGAEGAASVPDGLRALGHELLEETSRGAGLTLLVQRGRARPSGASLTRDQLLRYARQVVLPEVGEAGQLRLCAGEVLVAGSDAVADTAFRYVQAAGVGHVQKDETADATQVHAWTGAPEAALLVVRYDAGGRLGVARGDGGPASKDPPHREPVIGRAAHPTPIARALGALLADAACRLLVDESGKCEPPAIVLGMDGTIASRRSPAGLP